MDPFAPFKLVAYAWAWWVRKLGVKWLLILTGLSTVVVLILGCRESVAGGQVPVSDELGEAQPLVVACDAATALANAQGIHVRHCRRIAPEVYGRNSVAVFVHVVTDQGSFKLTFTLKKTLWSEQTLVVEQLTS